MTANVELFGKNMDVNDRLSEYVNKKAARLDRFLPGVDEIRIDLANIKTARSATDRHVAQITVRGKKLMLRAEERSDDIYVAYDLALDKIQRQMERYKGKHYRGRGDGAALNDILPNENPDPDDAEEEPVIARRKKFALLPMDENEAIEQMRLLGHENFFVFFNFNTNSVNVVYHRRDGSYGLLEPELA